MISASALASCRRRPVPPGAPLPSSTFLDKNKRGVGEFQRSSQGDRHPRYWLAGTGVTQANLSQTSPPHMARSPAAPVSARSKSSTVWPPTFATRATTAQASGGARQRPPQKKRTNANAHTWVTVAPAGTAVALSGRTLLTLFPLREYHLSGWAAPGCPISARAPCRPRRACQYFVTRRDVG
jgi:hypothetical protein